MAFDTVLLNNSILSSLSKAAEHFVIKMKDARSRQGLPAVIDEATSIDPPILTGDGNGSITIKIDLEKAPMAAAFEWGSGIHKMKGERALYPIEAKNAPNLVFWWEKGNKWFVGKKLPHGHPGVEPRPYITPTMVAEAPAIKQIIGREVKMALIGRDVVTTIKV